MLKQNIMLKEYYNYYWREIPSIFKFILTIPVTHKQLTNRPCKGPG